MNLTVSAITSRKLAGAVVSAIAVAMFVPLLAAAAPVPREAVLARGEVWVSARTPYSQSRYAYLDGSLVPTATTSPSTVGYRTDCSGFVSMCFGFTRSDGTPLSLDTASLPYRFNRITKEELRPGDLILRPKNKVVNGVQVPYGHAVVFVRWANVAKTRYVGYHESSSSRGTVAAEIGYPFYGEVGFEPYRYKEIEDVRLRKSRTWVSPLQPLTAGVLASSLSTFSIPSIGATPGLVALP